MIRVIPERLNLDRLAVSWRDYLVADLCIDPRELNARFAGGEQPARIDLDPVTCAAHVPRNNVGEYGTDIKVQQELLRHSTVQSTMNVYTQAFSEQKRAANSAVVDLLSGGQLLGSLMGTNRHRPLLCWPSSNRSQVIAIVELDQPDT
jgi:hypothetical protein